jgi:hydrogenase expression/formation protein HypD
VEKEITDAYRDPELARALGEKIRAVRLTRPCTLMHVCGTHEHAIARAGIRSFLPEGARLIAGPGCPVCVCPARDIDRAIDAARMDAVTIATFGDMVRVPSTETSLEEVRAEGCDVRVVYSPVDAVRIARENPDREVVFMAVGFETTAAPIAASLMSAPPRNLSVIASLRLIPPALRLLLTAGRRSLDGLILPGHVSTVIGRDGYRFLESEYGIPAVIAGFEAVDILRAIEELLSQVQKREGGRLVNQYRRVVHDGGNAKAREAIAAVFAETDAHWRGIGSIPRSGLALSERYNHLDAAKKLGLAPKAVSIDVKPGCLCHKVVLGEVEPEECALFGTSCTPRKAYGPCMVSSEGTCRARYEYRAVR